MIMIDTSTQESRRGLLSEGIAGTLNREKSTFDQMTEHRTIPWALTVTGKRTHLPLKFPESWMKLVSSPEFKRDIASICQISRRDSKDEKNCNLDLAQAFRGELADLVQELPAVEPSNLVAEGY